ncbi:hypothetical protein AV530_010455 [Patagioenas fasciata monilis]|uniref:Uncharacterized protein n=1 Tax=Patagioenas fasciata monilis TaxID=372326 RepID=A0A1V4KF12_PATFA|nr:hypothetical protein AV530_010455 [Patagioenas fasciata monilis]
MLRSDTAARGSRRPRRGWLKALESLPPWASTGSSPGCSCVPLACPRPRGWSGRHFPPPSCDPAVTAL